MKVVALAMRGKRLAAVMAVVALSSLTGCMGQRLCEGRISRNELRELRRAAHEEMDLRLVSGEKIREVEFVGRVGVAGQDFAVFENVKHEHILIRVDQIAAIRLAAEEAEKDRDEAGPGEKKDGEAKEGDKADKKHAEKDKEGGTPKAREGGRGDKGKGGPKDRENEKKEDRD